MDAEICLVFYSGYDEKSSLELSFKFCYISNFIRTMKKFQVTLYSQVEQTFCLFSCGDIFPLDGNENRILVNSNSQK